MKTLALILGIAMTTSVIAQSALVLTNDLPIPVCVSVELTDNCDTFNNTGTIGPLTIPANDFYVFNNGISATDYVYSVTINADACGAGCVGTPLTMGFDITTYSGTFTDCMSNTYNGDWDQMYLCNDVVVVLN